MIIAFSGIAFKRAVHCESRLNSIISIRARPYFTVKTGSEQEQA
jgi:hypothetical protein